MTFRIVVAVVSVLIGLASQTSPVTVPLVPILQGHFGVSVSVSAKAPTLFAIDTGVGTDYVSQKLVAENSLTPVGDYEYLTFSGRTFRTTTYATPPLSIGGVKLPDAQAMSWSGFEKARIPPLLSAWRFSTAPVTFDLRRLTLTFETPDSLAHLQSSSLSAPLEVDRRGLLLLPLVQMSFGHHQTGSCILDTGSAGTMLNDRHMSALGLHPKDTGVEAVWSQQPAGRLRQYFARIPELALTSQPTIGLKRPEVGFTGGAFDCQLGNDFWSGKAFMLDIPHRTLWLR